MENGRKDTQVSGIIDTTMTKIREMTDSNTIIGQPIQTPDGVTVIPISRVSIGFGAGGTDYGKTGESFGGGGGAGAKIDPVAFLIVKEGIVRVIPVAIPAASTIDRALDMVPELLDRFENMMEKRKADKEAKKNEV